MRVVRRLSVPTGDILVVDGERGALELLSLGDYGRDVNIKCDAIGLTREPSPVRHSPLLPLEEKWVVTVSTQYGCSMGCTFCDVPKVGPGRNATFRDLVDQVLAGLWLHPEIATTKRLNVHFARMGEPSWNPNVLDAARWLKRHVDPEYRVHPVVSTMMPRRNEWLRTFVHAWMRIKNRLYAGEAGLQISINSTDEGERERIFGGNACTLPEIAAVMEGVIPRGRKITLNFAVAGWTIDAERLREWFDPRDYIVKLTPVHLTARAVAEGHHTPGDATTYAPYRHHEEALKAAGFDVLVFIASEEEDRSRITCGNAILAGTLPETPFAEHSPSLLPALPSAQSGASPSSATATDRPETLAKSDASDPTGARQERSGR